MFKLFLIFALSIGVSVAQVTEQVKSIFNQKNILQNPGFESAFSKWNRSGGAWSIVTSGSNLGYGNISLTFNASSAGNYLESSLVTIPNGFAGIPLEGSCRIKTPSGTSTHLLQIRDSSSNILSSVSVNSSATFKHTVAQVAAVAEGTQIRIRIQPVAADEPLISIDDCYLGPATNIGTVSQATEYGSMTIPKATNCDFNDVTSASYADPIADSDCGTYVTTGNAVAPGTKLLQMSLPNAPPGNYLVEFQGHMYVNPSATQCGFAITDETNSVLGEVWVDSNSGNSRFTYNLVGRLTVSTVTNKTIKIRVKRNSGAAACGIWANGTGVSSSDMLFRVMRFPTSSETVYQANTTAWKVDANISGANPSLGTSSVSSYTGIENGSLTLTNNSGQGNIAAQIPCSSTNAPSGTTCSSGNESVGVSFTPPGGWTGDVLACASFGSYAAIGTTSDMELAFQIVETPSNAQTISQEGKTRFNRGLQAAAAMSNIMPVRVCGTFTFSSAGQKTLRVMYEQLINAGTITGSTVLADAVGTAGQRDIHWEVYPINQGVPAPVFIGSVTSNSSGAERVERATLECDASAQVLRQSGSWVSSIGNVSGSRCSVTIATGIFSDTPTCVATRNDTSTTATPGVAINVTSTTNFTIGVVSNTGATTTASSNEVLQVICIGPR